MDRALRADDFVEPRQVLLEHDAIEKHQRVERLVLSRRRHVAVDGQRRQKPRDLRAADLGGMALAVKKDVALDPADVGLLGAARVVACTKGLTHAVEQAQPGRPRRGCLADSEHTRR